MSNPHQINLNASKSSSNPPFVAQHLPPQSTFYPYGTNPPANPYIHYPMGIPPTGTTLLYYTPNTTGIATPLSTTTPGEAPDQLADVPRCHLHSKPQLNCKLCRKYKSAVYEIGRIGQAQQAQKPTEDRPNMVEMTDTYTFNVNNLLRTNILSSEYFKSLYSLKHFNEIVDELYQYAKHAEPYVAGNSRAPSTLFCCLYKFFTMKLTENQVSTLLEHPDSPYIRCSGFLYLRYVHPPDKLWSWYEPYFLDDEEFTAGSDKTKTTTIGEYAESLITEDKYYNTVLPRLPVKIKNQYGAQLIAMDEHRRRKSQNKVKLDFFLPGSKVSACSNGDWLDGEIVDIDDSIPGRISCLCKLEDGTEELIDIGLIVLPEKHRSRSRERKSHKKKSKKSKSSRRHSRSRSHEHRSDRYRDRRSRSRSQSAGTYDHKASKTQEELLDEFKRRERQKVLANGKEYARRPTSYKSSLSSKIDATSVKKRSLSPVRYTPRSNDSKQLTLENKKIEPSFEHKQKMAQLMERYSKTSTSTSKKSGDQEGPDVMRLG